MRHILLILLLVCPFAAIVADDHIQSTLLVEAGNSWNGAKLPGYPDGDPQISIARIHLAPGAALPPHQHPVINAGLVISGELTVFLESGEQRLLQAGEALIEVVDTWHYGQNTGLVPTDIVVFYAGTQDQPITELKPDQE